MCGGMDAGGGVELCSRQSLVRNASEYAEELQRCIRDASEKCRVRYAGSYSDNIKANELHVHAASKNLGTKLDSIRDTKALTAEENRPKGKRKDPNDPTWLAHQTCWKCGKIGHL